MLKARRLVKKYAYSPTVIAILVADRKPHQAITRLFLKTSHEKYPEANTNNGLSSTGINCNANELFNPVTHLNP
jgi:hypothetical protein